MKVLDYKHIHFKSGYKYQLNDTYEEDIEIFPNHDIETEFILLNKAGHLIIKRHYAWDGCSGTTIDTATNMRAGLKHDAIYQLFRMNQLSHDMRALADKMFHETCIEDVDATVTFKPKKAWLYTRYKTWYYAVRIGANSASLAKNLKQVLTAP